MSGRGSWSRRFDWISSVNGDTATLAELDRRLGDFYARAEQRAAYQAMLDAQEQAVIPPGSVRHLLPRHVLARAPRRLLEVGCGNGRLYRELVALGYQGAYTGLDMEPGLLAANRARHGAADWHAGSVYELPFEHDRFDLCFSLYVLEHLVYPERGLLEMLRVVRPGGELVLVFPDFVASGILPSQAIGLSPGGSARQKLFAGRPLDAALSLWDSRLRLRRRLRDAPERRGPFPVNARPLCLDRPELMAPDVDAVYLASKREIERWARGCGLGVRFPAGTEGELATQAFVALTKPGAEAG